MARGGKVAVDITADSKGFRRGTRDAERSLDRLGKNGGRAMRNLGRAGIAAGAAIATGLAVTGKIGFDKLVEDERNLRITQARIESTGQAANVTAKEIVDLSNALESQSGVSNGVVQAGNNLLLTFTNIKNEGEGVNAVFDRASQATLDLAISLNGGSGEGLDLRSAATQVGKALNDPVSGLTSLTRAGIQFTDQQKEQIKSLVESGDTLKAQKIVLAELETQFGGTGEALGRSTEGQINKTKRAFEAFAAEAARPLIPLMLRLTETLRSDVIPFMDRVATTVKRNWPAIQREIERAVDRITPTVKAMVGAIRSAVRLATNLWEDHGEEVTAVLKFVGRQIQRIAVIVREVVQLVAALLRGDFKEAFSSIKTIVSTAVGGMIDFLKTVPLTVAKIALDIGKKIARGIVRGLAGLGKSLGGAIKDALEAAINGALDSIRGIGIPGFDPPGPGPKFPGIKPFENIPRVNLVRGGEVIPGARGMGDSVPILAAPGETHIVLTPKQSRMVDGGMPIGEALARTGGSRGGGGRRFQRGGVLENAISFAKAQVGEPYVWGGGHSFGDHSGWDCSGFASNVAARIPGYTGGIGTTMSLYPISSPARGGEPVVFGFRGMQNSSPSRQHMGIKIGGVWYDAGSGGVETNQSDGSWNSGLRIPPGLEYLATGEGPDGSGFGGGSGGGGSASRTPAQNRTSKKSIVSSARKLLGAPPAEAPSVSDRFAALERGSSLRDKKREDHVRTKAAEMGITNPEKIDAIAQAELLKAERNRVNKKLRIVQRAARKASNRRRKLRKRQDRLFKALRKTPARQQGRLKRLRDKIRDLREKLGEVRSDLRGLITQAADLRAEAAELGFDIGQLEKEIVGLANVEEPDEPDASTTDESDVADTGDDAADQAAEDERRAREDRTALERDIAIDQAHRSEDFIRTANASGDLASTIVNINIAGGVFDEGGLAAALARGAAAFQSGVPATAIPSGA